MKENKQLKESIEEMKMRNLKNGFKNLETFASDSYQDFILKFLFFRRQKTHEHGAN